MGLLITIFLAGCGPKFSPEQRATQVAYAQAREQFDYSEDIRRLPPRIEDLGDRWRIHFQLRPESAGGRAPQIEVRKSDLSVVSSISGQ
jgi:hypothetical protein